MSFNTVEIRIVKSADIITTECTIIQRIVTPFSSTDNKIRVVECRVLYNTANHIDITYIQLVVHHINIVKIKVSSSTDSDSILDKKRTSYRS